MIQTAATPTLHVAYLVDGPANGDPVFLLHGWPDDARTYDKIAPALHRAGLRTITPWLRGFGQTTFVSPETPRSGEMVAMAQDVIDLADALKIEKFAVVGHDWGARIAYVLGACFPERATRIVAMSVGWAPGELTTPDFEQSRKYWYQWFMATQRGADAVRKDAKSFARIMWDTWAPTGWYDEDEFKVTAESFENPTGATSRCIRIVCAGARRRRIRSTQRLIEKLTRQKRLRCRR